MAFYYQNFKADLVEAANMCQKNISLAILTGNSRRHSQALHQLAWINFRLGEYSVAQMYAYEARKLARVSGSLHIESQIIRIQAICWKELGHYNQSLSLCIVAKHLVGLCGMSGGEADLAIMTIQAEVHKCKSEYSEAWKIHTKLVQILADQNSYLHALALLNFAELGVLIGVPQHDVRWNIDHARGMFTSRGRKSVTVYCDTILADLYLREQDLLEAKTLFEKSLKLASEDGQVQSFCFEKLGNASQWGADYSMFQWTTMFLVYSVKCKQPLNVHKALQFLGDTFLQKDEDTAIALLTVALEGFTYMDVHRSRAECMLRLGDISKSRGDMLKAVELWTTAQPLFERSSQVKQVQCVDERLAGIGSDVLEQQKENIAHLVELNVPSGNPRDIQDEEQVGLSDQPHEQVVV
jgi:tetratricopeptide (TPR) repeat protein